MNRIESNNVTRYQSALVAFTLPYTPQKTKIFSEIGIQVNKVKQRDEKNSYLKEQVIKKVIPAPRKPRILIYLLAGVPFNLRGFLTEVSVGSGHISSER